MRDRIRPAVQSVTAAFGSKLLLGLVVAIALACALLLASQKLQPSDDAYITFRHVRNLLEHGRPAWNLSGNPVLGTTSPAFGLALALFCKATCVEQVHHAALLFNAFLHFLIVVVAYLVAKDLIGRAFPAIFMALLAGLNSPSLYIFSQGFESALLVVTLLAALYSLRRGHDRISLVLTSLAPLVRPEGVLLWPIVWGYVLAKKRFKKGHLLTFLVIPAVWLAVSIPYYGSPIPHAVLAKKKFPLIYQPYAGPEVNLLERLPGVFAGTARLWDEPAGPLLLDGTSTYQTDSAINRCRKWIILAGLPLGLLALPKRKDARLLYWVYPFAFLLLYGWLGHTKPWYFPSFILFSLLLLFGGWVCGVDWICHTLGQRKAIRAPRPVLLHALSCMLCAVFLTANSYTVNRGQFRFREKSAVFPSNPWNQMWDLWEKQRFYAYREAAEYLNEITGESGVAMISEVGVFGYFYAGDVIDTVGLCSPEALPFYPPPPWDIRDSSGNDYTKANNFTPTQMVMTLKPDFVVNSRFYVANLLRPDSPFLEAYDEIARLRRVWGEPILVFGRKSIPANERVPDELRPAPGQEPAD
jgi:hypothetical protein